MDTAVGVLLSDDLIFTSRITGVARAQQGTIVTATTVEELRTLVRTRSPQCVLLDLTHEGLDIVALVNWLRSNGTPAPRVIGYGPHVDAALLRAAREAGCDEVLPRSKFVEVLPTAVVRWLQMGANASSSASEEVSTT